MNKVLLLNSLARFIYLLIHRFLLYHYRITLEESVHALSVGGTQITSGPK